MRSNLNRFSLLCQALAAVFLLFIVFASPLGAVASNRLPQLSETYLSPKSNATWVEPGEVLLFRSVQEQSSAHVLDWTVTGRQSGDVEGRWELCDDGATWRFIPAKPFLEGDRLTATVRYSLGRERLTEQWMFSIRPVRSQRLLAAMSRDKSRLEPSSDVPGQLLQSDSETPTNAVPSSDLPAHLPICTVTTSGNAYDANLLTSIGEYTYHDWYPAVVNQNGEYEYFNFHDNYRMYFGVDDNAGLFADCNPLINGYEIFDTTMTLIDTVEALNYPVDEHEIQFLDNGHTLLLARQYQEMDLSGIVDGGQEDATVVGTVIQELDESGQLFFQWRSLDDTSTVQITDAGDDIDLTTADVDYVHANSIEVDLDGNLILSCRHLNQIFKINKTTGHVMWKFGGRSSDFQCDDPIPLSGQHDARILPNGNMTIFDNGSFVQYGYGRAVEYAFDMENMQVHLVWSYGDDQKYRSDGRGSCRRLPNGNTLIGWGSISGETPSATEVDADGLVVRQFKFHPLENSVYAVYTYRVQYTNLKIVAARPQLLYEVTEDRHIRLTFSKFGDENVVGYRIYLGDDLEGVGVYKDTTACSMVLPTLMYGSGFAIARVTALYADDSESEPSNELSIDLSLQSVDDPSREVLPTLPWLTVDAYPNPFNSSTRVRVIVGQGRLAKVELFDLLGRKVGDFPLTDPAATSYSWNFDGSHLASGIYLIRASNLDGRQATGRLVLVK